MSCLGGRRIYCCATPLSHPATAAQHNRLGPPQPGSPEHAHWLPDSMPAPAMTVKPSDLWPPARPARRRPGSPSRWPRHPHNRTHSHCPQDDARLPPDRTPQPRQTARPPPAGPRHCACRAGPGRGRHDRPTITNTDHKSRAQKSFLPPPGASGTKYPSSSRTTATSAATASLISARPGSSGLSGRILRLSRGGLSGPRTSSGQQQAHDTGQYHDDTDDVHVQAMGGARRGRAGGAARGYRPGSVLTDARPGGTPAACWALSRSAPGSCRSV